MQRRRRDVARLHCLRFRASLRPAGPLQAVQVAGIHKQDRALYRRRLNLGLEQPRTRNGVAPDKLAAIGYCFGATGVLEMARSGAAVAGVVSFHGRLDSPAPEDAKQVKAKVLFKLVTTTRAGLRITKKRIVACGKR